MNLRTVLIVVATLLLVTSIFGATSSDDEQAVKPPERTTPASPLAPATDGAVRGTLPRDEVVRAREGQLVELTVTAERPESASIAELGQTDAVAPGAPAVFSFVAPGPGSYPVTLDLAERRIGRVVVEPAKD